MGKQCSSGQMFDISAQNSVTSHTMKPFKQPLSSQMDPWFLTFGPLEQSITIGTLGRINPSGTIPTQSSPERIYGRNFYPRKSLIMMTRMFSNGAIKIKVPSISKKLIPCKLISTMIAGNGYGNKYGLKISGQRSPPFSCSLLQAKFSPGTFLSSEALREHLNVFSVVILLRIWSIF